MHIRLLRDQVLSNGTGTGKFSHLVLRMRSGIENKAVCQYCILIGNKTKRVTIVTVTIYLTHHYIHCTQPLCQLYAA